LTKTHEEFILTRLEAHATVPDDLLGEITVVVGPPESVDKPDDEAVLDLIREESAAGGKPRDIARRVKDRVLGWSVGEIYQLMQR
jgi:16S rRNA (cytidine1402-2'-O)-methyltransferase